MFQNFISCFNFRNENNQQFRLKCSGNNLSMSQKIGIILSLALGNFPFKKLKYIRNELKYSKADVSVSLRSI